MFSHMALASFDSHFGIQVNPLDRVRLACSANIHSIKYDRLQAVLESQR